MSRAVFRLILAVSASVLWIAVVLVASLQGWWREPLAPRGDTLAFIGALEQSVPESFRGNLVAALVEAGEPVGHIAVGPNVAEPGMKSVFQVASLSKWVTAVGVLTLIVDGVLALDDPVSLHLTRWQLPEGSFNKEVTVRRLLSHTAGLTDGLGYNGFANTDDLQTAASNERLVIKTPSSAGAMGNLLFSAKDVRHLPLHVIREHILRRLESIGWRGYFPVQVGAWEENTLASPSAQVWIPSAAVGDPVIEGLYMQTFSDKAGRFSGATDADIPDDVSQIIADEAMQLAYLFQSLGYFGRVSFDALLCGDALRSSSLHWIECNARWGGVSIPMTIANRLGARYPNSRKVIVQLHVTNRYASFADQTAACVPLQYSHRTQEGMVWLNAVLPSIPLETGIHGNNAQTLIRSADRGTGFMCISNTLDKAMNFSAQAIESLQKIN